MEAKIPANRIFNVIVASMGIILGLGILLLLTKFITFEYHDSGVVGWLSEHCYPKQQEIFYFIFALTFVPTVTIACWGLWLWYSGMIASVTKTPLSRVLKQDALTYLFLVFILNNVHLKNPSFQQLLLLPILFFLAGKGFFIIFEALRARGYLSSIRFPFWRQKSQKSREKTEKASRTRTFRWILAVVNSPVIFYILIPIAIWAFLYQSNIHGEIDLFHEGERLGPVSDLLRSKVPYRDIYVQHGLFLNIYKTWLAFKLFGETIHSDRVLGNSPYAYPRGLYGILAPVGFVCVYFLALSVYRSRATALFTVVVLLVVDLWLNDRYALCFLGLTFVAVYVDKRKWWWVLVAGIMTMYAIFYSLDTGFYALMGGILYLLFFETTRQDISFWRRLVPLGTYLLGILIAFAPFGIYFGINHALDDMIWVSYIQTKYQIPIWGLPFPSLIPELAKTCSLGGWKALITGQTIKWYLPPFLFIVGLIYLAIKAILGVIETRDRKLAIILFASIAAFRSALGRSDYGHLVFSMPLSWLTCIFFVEKAAYAIPSALRRRGNIQVGGVFKTVCLSILLSMFLLHIFYAYNKPPPHPNIMNARTRIDTIKKRDEIPKDYVISSIQRIGPILIPKNQAVALEKEVSYIQSHTLANDPIFDMGNQGACYFLANRPNPTRYYQIIYASTPKMQKEVVADLEKTPPKYVIMGPVPGGASWFASSPDGVPLEERLPIIFAYIRAHYREEQRVGNRKILRRCSD